MRALLLALPLAACADVTPIEDGAVYGEVTVLKDLFTSAALIRTADGAVLVDAGIRAHRVRDRLADEGIAPADVAGVLLTHGHGDHIRGLDDFPDAPVFGHALERPLVEAEGGRLDAGVADGTTLTFGDTDIEVFHLGHHTPGTAAYRVGATLLVGDACVVDGDGAVASTPAKYSDDPAGLDRALADLARALEARGQTIDWVVPSHSGPVKGLGPLLAFADRVGGTDTGAR